MIERHEQLARWIDRNFPIGRVAWEGPFKAVVIYEQGEIPVEMIGNGIWAGGKMVVPASSLTY